MSTLDYTYENLEKVVPRSFFGQNNMVTESVDPKKTMLLALAGEERDYSLGSQLSLADADRIAELAALHGFEPAPTQWYGEMATEADLDAFAAHVRVPLRRTAFQAAG